MRVVRSVLAMCVAACRFEPSGGADHGDDDVAVDARASDDAQETAIDAAACPPTYVAIADGRYRRVADAATWEVALADCADDSAGQVPAHTHLVVFGADDERARVRDAFPGPSLWIGLSDRVTSFAWLWITEEDSGAYPPPTGAPWKDGQPTNGSGGRQDCVLMEPDGRWDDRICDADEAEYVCECDAYAQRSEHL